MVDKITHHEMEIVRPHLLRTVSYRRYVVLKLYLESVVYLHMA